MKKRVLGLIVALLVAFINFAPTSASTQDFTINSFDSNYLISRDTDGVSMAYVREGIVAEFPNFDQNHGILRALPDNYQGHSLELKIDAVVDQDRNPYKYETYTENGNLVLKIGDPDKYVHGTQKYFIDYHMRGVTAKFTDHDEFFWNINGTQWQQPMGRVTALVRVEDAARGTVPDSALLDKTACYTGVEGSKEANCTITKDSKGITYETTAPLLAGENLSVVASFAKDTFAEYKPSLSQILWWVAVAVFYAGPAILALVIVISSWWRFGRDPSSKGVVVPQYLPPKDETVLVSGMVLNEVFNPKYVTATIIDLAVRHYFKIYEVKDKPEDKYPQDYEIELVKSVDKLTPEEKQVVGIVFSDSLAIGTKVLLGTKKVGSGVAITALGSSLDATATARGYFKGSPAKASKPFVLWGGILVVIGFVVPPYTVGLAFAGAILVISAFAMPARSQKGVDLRTYLLGLRDYIKLAEADRLKVLQSPHGELTEKIDVGDKRQLIKLYERLLPYAVLFGLEKDWAKEMAGLYDTETPSWYGTNGAFNAAYFASSVGGFSTASATAFAPPSSSSGSGFSGGSGGGGGGGGGGGW